MACRLHRFAGLFVEKGGGVRWAWGLGPRADRA